MGRKIFIESMNAESQSSLFPETSPTNSSQSDTLQVKSLILVKHCCMDIFSGDSLSLSITKQGGYPVGVVGVVAFCRTNVELGWRFIAQYSACRTLQNLFSSSNQTRIIQDNILISLIIKRWPEVELNHRHTDFQSVLSYCY